VDGLPETDYFDVTLRDGAGVLRPVAISATGSRLATVRKKIRKLGLTSKDIDHAIRWARSRRYPRDPSCPRYQCPDFYPPFQWPSISFGHSLAICTIPTRGVTLDSR